MNFLLSAAIQECEYDTGSINLDNTMINTLSTVGLGLINYFGFEFKHLNYTKYGSIGRHTRWNYFTKEYKTLAFGFSNCRTLLLSPKQLLTSISIIGVTSRICSY